MSNTPTEFWRIATVMKVTGLCKSQIYAKIAKGDFPQSRRYCGGGGAYWISDEVTDWQRAEMGMVA